MPQLYSEETSIIVVESMALVVRVANATYQNTLGVLLILQCTDKHSVWKWIIERIFGKMIFELYC